MREYIVDIELISSEVRTFRVDADSYQAAEERAYAMADSVKWTNPHWEFQVLNSMTTEDFNAK
jgi:hypothetical protein